MSTYFQHEFKQMHFPTRSNYPDHERIENSAYTMSWASGKQDKLFKDLSYNIKKYIFDFSFLERFKKYLI